MDHGRQTQRDSAVIKLSVTINHSSRFLSNQSILYQLILPGHPDQHLDLLNEDSSHTHTHTHRNLDMYESMNAYKNTQPPTHAN